MFADPILNVAVQAFAAIVLAYVLLGLIFGRSRGV